MRGKQTIRGMFQSMAVIGVVVAGIYMLVPHDENKDPIRTVDYRVELVTAQRAAPYPVAAPEGLGKGWRATSVTFERENAHAWHLGFLDPDDQYVAVEQSTAQSADKYVREVTHEAAKTERTRQVAGRTWQYWEGPKYDALVLTADGSTTVVTGTATPERLAEMAAALESEEPGGAGDGASAGPSAKPSAGS
ncbi:DUF4245 domain-containing protein [Streptomyces xantholiticus]|uniref:DUF4245 domain-containing protein n=1 Tax=Streptomyces xantholiticus TaxID=68285 RepID=UPI0016774FCC|nr:DUF4245 domain-containing protein [Streptomyces xantholiticus]GGW48365.1 hypothetical protein GCM10010381_37160 [Streptomyces xantholiticus]